MKHLRLAVALTLLCGAPFAWANPTVASLGSSITISDGNFSGVGWYGNHEDNETEANPFTVKGQDWDLESMNMNGRYLTLIGGFDFKNGNNFSGYTYRGGDIFIDVNGDAKYTQANNGNSGLGGSSTNSYGYDYVIHFNAGVTAYSVYQINSSTILKQSMDVQASDPWVYVSGGTLLESNVSINGYGLLTQPVYSQLTTFGSTTTGLQGYANSSTGVMDNNHYYLTVNTNFLPTNVTATYHYTMECGNDNIMGRAVTMPRVPETASTIALLAIGLFPLCVRRRKVIVR